MSGFSVSSQLAISDWKAYQSACVRKTQTRGRRGTALTIGIPLLMGLLGYTLTRTRLTVGEANSLFVGIMVGYGGLLLLARILRAWMRPTSDGAFLGAWTFEFTPSGLRVRRPLLAGATSWNAVREITSTADHIFVWIDTIAAYVVPVRDLPAGMSREDALSILRDLKAQPAPPIVEETEFEGVAAIQPFAAAPQTPQSPRSGYRSMQALARWLTWRPFDARALEAPDSTIAALMLLSILMWVGLNRIGVGPHAQFNYFGAQVLGCQVLGLLAVAWVIWRTSDPQVAWRAVLLILAVLTLLAIPAEWGIHKLGRGGIRVAASFSVLALQLLYLGRAFRTATGYLQVRAIVLSLASLIVGTALVGRYLQAGPMWYVPETDEQDTYMRSSHEAERLLMGQPARIEAAVAKMSPRSGATSMYMVGFAGVGEQKVFAGEISLAEKVVGERFGTQNRSLLLINDQRDLETHPLATVTGLKLALTDIGQRMDREHDVLILAISSHGSKDPAISVSNGALPLNELTGNDLKSALDDAGIRWRVVIISACHAGAFIPYLSDERSIIIAAAAPDRSSFGCSNDRDLTDFGEAFLRDALPNATSLRAAFESARGMIEERERKEHRTPSQPTAYFGAAIEKKLEATNGAARPTSAGAP